MKKLKIFGVPLLWYLIILLIVVIFVVTVYRRSRALKSSKKTESQKESAIKQVKRAIDSVYYDRDEFTRKLFLAQAMHETNDFTSPVFIRNNNLFGMKVAVKRTFDGLGDVDGDNFQNYKDIKQSASDHRLYLESVGLNKDYKSPESYLFLLKKKGYYEDEQYNYARGVKSRLNYVDKKLKE